MRSKKYSASAVKVCFWFCEFRKVVSLLHEGNSIEDVKEQNRQQNIFAVPTPLRAAQICNTVSARVNSLDSSFYPLFLESDLATQKLFALIAAMAHDALFFDFVYEVVREKMIIGTNELSDRDVRVFFKEKQVQSEKVAGWTDATLNRLGRCYCSMLHEAGILDRSRHVRKIFRPILMPELQRWLDDQRMGVFIHTLTGVR